MIAFRCKTWMAPREVRKAVEEASVDPLHQCALEVESEMKRSMKGGGGKDRIPSEPGEPPHAQTGNLRSAITTARTPRNTYYVGPTVRAWYGRVMEYGPGHLPGVVWGP